MSVRPGTRRRDLVARVRALPADGLAGARAASATPRAGLPGQLDDLGIMAYAVASPLVAAGTAPVRAAWRGSDDGSRWC